MKKLILIGAGVSKAVFIFIFFVPILVIIGYAVPLFLVMFIVAIPVVGLYVLCYCLIARAKWYQRAMARYEREKPKLKKIYEEMGWEFKD